MELIKNILLVFFGYISGSFPPAYVLVKLFKNKDIRKIGSRNVGTMNVLRNVDIILGIITGILDITKGFIPVYLANKYSMIQWIPLLVVVAAVAGHNWSIFLNLTGGKGVATTLGGILALGLTPNFNFFVIIPSIIGLILALIFFRDFYMGALLAYLVSPFSFLYFRKSWVEATLVLILAIIVIYKIRFDLKRYFDKRRKVIS
jgi:glycerol-3-phosphate acyltransferase PlsY